MDLRLYCWHQKNLGWIINFLFFDVIPTNNLLVFFILKNKQFLKLYSSINLSFIVSPRNERSTYIKDFNLSWSTKSPHYRAAIFTFIFISSKRMYSLVFIIYEGDYCCFDEDVHTLTSSFILSTRLLILHLRIPIYSSSLLLSFVSSFTVSMWFFLLHLGILISSYSLLFPFTSSFVFSILLFLLPLRIIIYPSSLLLASLHCGVSTLKFEF